MHSKVFQRIPKDFKVGLQRIARILKDFYGFQGIHMDSMEFLGTPKDSKGFQGIQRDSKGIQGNPRYSKGFQGILKDSKKFQSIPKDF